MQLRGNGILQSQHSSLQFCASNLIRMPVTYLLTGCILLKRRVILGCLIIFFLLEKSNISSAQALPRASKRHIDDVDVHFHEYHLEDDFRPSEILGPIGGIKTSGPIITSGEKFSLPQPKKPHWLGGSNQFRNR